jgi:hydrogenase expression/formation protein HypC
MCLGVPGKVVEWIDRDPLFAKARIEFGGIERVCSMACVPEAAIGDYVIVHAGIAIAQIDQQQAGLVYQELRRLRLLDLSDEADDSHEVLG